MIHVKSDSKLAAVLIDHPAIIPVVNRLGVDLGVGDASIEASCRSHGIDKNLFIAVVNTYLSDTYDPAPMMARVDVSSVRAYAVSTDNYYYNQCLPNIERHLRALLSASAPGSSLEMMSRLFAELKRLLSERVGGHESAGTDSMVIDMLGDLRSIMIVHLRGAFDRNLIYAVIVAVTALENDMRCNLRLMHSCR